MHFDRTSSDDSHSGPAFSDDDARSSERDDEDEDGGDIVDDEDDDDDDDDGADDDDDDDDDDDSNVDDSEEDDDEDDIETDVPNNRNAIRNNGDRSADDESSDFHGDGFHDENDQRVNDAEYFEGNTVKQSTKQTANPDITLTSKLHPVSTPAYPDNATEIQQDTTQQLIPRSHTTFRLADAARAAKEKFNRRWSFHRRPPSWSDRPPSRASSISSEQTNHLRQLANSPLPNDRNDFLSPAFASSRAPPSTAPPTLSPKARTQARAQLQAQRQTQAQPVQRLETIDIPVKSWVLQGNGTAPRKSSRLLAWSKKLGPSKTVRVECNTSGLAPMVLYASDQVLTTTRTEPFKVTESITSRPEYIDKESLVYRDSPFEIGVIGMSISGQDFKLGYPDFNEVLMYSMQREPGEQGEEGDALPFIHYDPTQDEKSRGMEPDQFIAIPASKSLFLASDGGSDSTNGVRKSVNCRFKVLELDSIDEMMQMSLAGIEQLGHHVQQYSVAAPALGLLTPAVSLASMVSKRALESHARPDKVIMIDMNFLLADRRKPETNDVGTEIPFENRSGEYLRYGYYFFLERGVEAKLYASFRTFPNVSLMMKRMDKPGPNEKQFFPLTGVSYLVIRVTPRLSSVKATRRPIRLRHVQKLEQLMKSSLRYTLQLSNEESARSIVHMLSELGEELGIAQRDLEGKRNKKREDKGHQITRANTSVKSGHHSTVRTKKVTVPSVGSTRLNGRASISPMAEALGLSMLSDWPSVTRVDRAPQLSLPRSSSSGPRSERSNSTSAIDGNERDLYPQYTRLPNKARTNWLRSRSTPSSPSAFRKS